MATTQDPAVIVSVTPTAAVEVKRFMEQEGVVETGGGRRQVELTRDDVAGPVVHGFARSAFLVDGALPRPAP